MEIVSEVLANKKFKGENLSENTEVKNKKRTDFRKKRPHPKKDKYNVHVNHSQLKKKRDKC